MKANTILLAQTLVIAQQSAWCSKCLGDGDNQHCRSQIAVVGKSTARPKSDLGLVMLLAHWFAACDRLLANALGTQSEQKNNEATLADGLSPLATAEQRTCAFNLLHELSLRCKLAAQEMDLLPRYPEVELLRQSYRGYFSASQSLCDDCLAAKDEFSAATVSTSPKLMAFFERKRMLSIYGAQCKTLANLLRKKLAIQSSSL